MILVLLLLSANSGWQPEKPTLAEQRLTSRKVSEAPSTQEQYLDIRSLEYKSGLAARLDDHRAERYGQITECRFEKLRELILEYSDTFVVEGAPIGVIDGYEFDIELEPNARPVRHQLPKRSQKNRKRSNTTSLKQRLCATPVYPRTPKK